MISGSAARTDTPLWPSKTFHRKRDVVGCLSSADITSGTDQMKRDFLQPEVAGAPLFSLRIFFLPSHPLRL